MVNGSKVAIGAAALLALASLAKRGSRSLDLAQKPTDSELSYMEYEFRRGIFSSEEDARTHVCAKLNKRQWWLDGLYKRTGRDPGSFRVEDLACQAYPIYKVSGGWKVGKKPAWLKIMTGKEYTSKVIEEIEWMQEQFQKLGFSSVDQEHVEYDEDPWGHGYDEDGEDDEGEEDVEVIEEIRPITGFRVRLDISHNIPEWVYDYLSENVGKAWRYDRHNVMEEVNNLIEREINKALKGFLERSGSGEFFNDYAVTEDQNDSGDLSEIGWFFVKFKDSGDAKLERLKDLAKESSRGSVSGSKIDTLRKSTHELELSLSRARVLLGAEPGIGELAWEIQRRVEAQLDSSRWWVNHLKKLRIEVDEDDIEEDLRQDPGYEWVDDG
jgi:hypothetical protein